MPSFGAVEAVLFHITTNETFTVPAGKVLIVEKATYAWPGLRFQNGTNGFTLDVLNDPTIGVALPLKLPEGWTIRGVVNGSENTDTWVFGLLVSTTDLFASVPHRIDQMTVNGSMASLDIQMASARPARIAVEESSEANQGWHAAENAVVRPTADKSRYGATVFVGGDKGFIRTKARPR